MKILAFEYACAGGEGGELFFNDGLHMLTHLLRGLFKRRIGKISTMVFPEFGVDLLFADDVIKVHGDLFKTFTEEVERHDAVWIVAPETGGILLRYTLAVEKAGKRLLGSSSSAVEICGNKLLTHMALKGVVPMPRTVPFDGTFPQYPCVVKPIDGAACDNTFFVADEADGRRFFAPDRKYVAQPFIEGTAMSAGVVSNGERTVLLGVSRQLVEMGRTVVFNGVEGPVDYSGVSRLEAIVRSVKEHVPGLEGYWGVDFIDAEEGPVLIEVNPRLTSSFPLYPELFKVFP
ncbi:MAG: ATP-grasp domain-containing protein [Nitrospinae bacterium]|nr:ATP-grasp domain-containing protein [Nitrospinota bacterium]